VIDSFDLPVDE